MPKTAESGPSGHSAALLHHGDFTVTPRVLTITALALGIGVISAFLALGLLRLIGLATNLFFFGRVGGRLPDIATTHLGWERVFIPVIGGLVVGLMAKFGSEKIRGHGMPEAIEAVLTQGSRVQPRVAVLKPLSAAIAIGSGGPFGAEGPIIMTGGAVGSILAQFLRLTADERKTLLVAGAAGGMAATFNSPLAAILLAVELLLFEWRPRSFIPVAAGAGIATVVRGYLLGTGAIFPAPAVHHAFSPQVYPVAVAIGLGGGLLALVATRLVYLSEDLFSRLPIHWMWWPAIGGLVIGIGGVFSPRSLGVGYDSIRALLNGHLGVSVIVGIVVVKTLIWSLSLGSGTSGGVLAPLFLIGAGLGALASPVLPHVVPGFWPLIAVSAVLAGVMRAPLTGVVFAIEVTHDLAALVPMVLASSAAYLLSVLVLKRSILTEKVARRGFHLTREYDVDPLEVLFVREVMSKDVITFDADAELAAVRQSFLTQRARQSRDPQHRQRLYPVLDRDGRLAGVITRRDVLDSIINTAMEGEQGLRLADLLEPSPLVALGDETLRQVAYRMAEHGVTRLPVVERSDRKHLVGLVSLGQLLEGRLRDLEEARTTERVLHIRRLFPTTAGRFRSQEETVVAE